MLIGKSRRDGVDWVQDRLGYIGRPLAEMIYRGLVKRGLIVESEDGDEILVENYLDPDHMREVGLKEYQANERNTELNRRRSRSTSRRSAAKQRRSMTWKAPEYTDDLSGPTDANSDDN
jgi:hypothetical protein